VLRLIANEFTPPKVKYFIIIGSCSDKIACIVLNTEPRYTALAPGLQGQQYPLQPGDCKCIKHESFVNCAELRELDKSSVNQILQKDPGRKECVLTTTHISGLLSIVKRSKTITPAQKKIYSLV
jgi:hypothetical protein